MRIAIPIGIGAIGEPATVSDESCFAYSAATGASPKYASTRPALSAATASVSFGNALTSIAFFPCFCSFLLSAIRKSRFVVPVSTEMEWPDRLVRLVMCFGLPFLTRIDCPTFR